MTQQGTVQRCRLGVVGLLVMVCALQCLMAAPASALEDADCFVCHGDPELTKTTAGGAVVPLYVDEAIYAKSIHGPMGCVGCHSSIAELPHAEQLAPVNCGECHGEAEIYAQSLHGKALVHGDKDVAACQDCHGKHDILPSANLLSRTHPRNLPQTCGRCHSDAAMVQRHMVSIADPSQSYLKSDHAQAVLEKGNYDAASCNDCHGTHDILPSQDPKSPVYRENIPRTCGTCHAEILREFEASIHGQALAAGIKDAPTCIDCHGEHDIESPLKEASLVNLEQVSKTTCPRCHDSERIMKRYGVATMRQASYMDSYHGMASAAGSRVVASCTSCHGVHNILPAADPLSSINHANLPKTCAQCHEGAGPNFASSPVHIIPTDPGQKILGIVRLVYIWAIILTIGTMVIHNTLLMLRHSLAKLRTELYGPKSHRRFTRGQTLGHFMLTISFIALVISGFALRYPESWWAQFLFVNSTGLELRGAIHRIAAILLIAVSIVNAVYVVATRAGRSELRAFMLRWQDLKDAGRNMAYALGLTNRPPRFDRYSYSEKLEYWGLWWGSVLMIITGFIMWFAEDMMRYYPKLVVDVSALIHFYEAWLATATIVVWHFYYMIFDPETYPMNWSWITGRITEEDFKERHPIEFEEKVLRQSTKAETPSASSSKSPSAPAEPHS